MSQQTRFGDEVLLKSMSRFIRLQPEEERMMLKLFFPRKLNKKEHWIMPGDHCREIAFIVSGCLRYYYSKNDVERTGQFFFEGGWFTDYESWVTRQPATVGIDAIEPTQLLIIPFIELERLYDENPKFERLGRLMAENTIIGIRNRNLSLLNNSPEERYMQLLNERPKVIERIPQHLIASYLGIEPETLSRIRKKIAEKGA
jgi:CRP/FNR family transcriptional regulator, anaerobic regulatory protein